MAKKPNVKETFNIKPNINLKKALSKEGITNTSDKSKTDKVNITTKKSPSLVISFSDWLKTKKQTATSKVNETNKPTENQSKLNETLTTTSKVASNIQDKTFEIVEKPATKFPDNTMVSQQLKGKVSNTLTQDKQKRINKTLNETQTTNEDELNSTVESTTDTSHLQDEETEDEMETKKTHTNNNKNLSKNTVKRKRSKSGKFLSVHGSPKPRIINKNKKTEIDILIESMSKEMKESGITELLNTDTHIKRPRITKRSLAASEDLPLNATPSTTVPAETITSSTNTQEQLATNKDIPKVLDFSQNLDVQITENTTSISSKSPTKRKQAQQNAAKSRKSIPTIIQTTISNENNAKVLPAKSRNTINIHEPQATQQVTVQNVTTIKTPTQIKSRKSLPLTTKEAKMNVGQTKNIKSRKSLVPPKADTIQVLTSKEVFKTPKTPTTSKVLSAIPNAENIKKLYVANDTTKRSDSCMKVSSNRKTELQIK